MPTQQEVLNEQAQALAKRINDSEGLKKALLNKMLAKDPALQKQYDAIQHPQSKALNADSPLKVEFDAARMWVMAKVFHELKLEPERESQKKFFEQMEENKRKYAQENTPTPTVDAATQALEDTATIEGVDWSDWPDEKIQDIINMTDDPSLPDFGEGTKERMEELAEIGENIDQNDLFQDQLMFLSPYNSENVREERRVEETLERLETFNQENNVTEKKKSKSPFDMPSPSDGPRPDR